MLKSVTWHCIATFIINMVRSMKAQKNAINGKKFSQ